MEQQLEQKLRKIKQSMKSERITVKRSTYNRAREYAIKNGYKINEFIDIAIRLELERREKYGRN